MGAPVPLPHGSDTVAGVLSDDRRRGIYLHVKQHAGPVTVNEVAEAFSIHRNAAKFHLDKLMQAGLLRAEFRRVNGRRGPGAGRPSKLYSATEREVSFTVPERHYDLLAHLLLQALTSGEGLEAVGIRFGRDLAAAATIQADGRPVDPVEGLKRALEQLGFEPTVEVGPDGFLWVTSENCPFGRVAMDDCDGEVCRLDRAIIRGILEGFGVEGSDVREHTSMRLGHDVCVREVVPAGRIPEDG